MKRFLAAGLTTIGVASITLAFAHQPASAAFLSICDSAVCGSADPNILFSANDFEGSFQVNGTTIQSGFGSPGSTSVSENGSFVGGSSEIDFTGVWLGAGQVTPKMKR